MNEIEVKIDDVIKVNTDEGDTLLVRLPPMENAPDRVVEAFSKRVSDAFKETFKDKNVKILVVPHLMQVEIIKGSLLEDNE